MSSTSTTAKPISKNGNVSSASVKALLKEYEAMSKAQKLNFEDKSADEAARQTKKSYDKRQLAIHEAIKAADPLLKGDVSVAKTYQATKTNETFLAAMGGSVDGQLTPEDQVQLCDKLVVLGKNFLNNLSNNDDIDEHHSIGKSAGSAGVEDEDVSEGDNKSQGKAKTRSASLPDQEDFLQKNFSYDSMSEDVNSGKVRSASLPSGQTFQDNSYTPISDAGAFNSAMCYIYKFLESITTQETDMIHQYVASENSILKQSILSTKVFATNENALIDQSYNFTMQSANTQKTSAYVTMGQASAGLLTTGLEYKMSSTGKEVTEASNLHLNEIGTELEKLDDPKSNFALPKGDDFGKIVQDTSSKLAQNFTLSPESKGKIQEIVKEYTESGKLSPSDIRNAFAQHVLSQNLETNAQPLGRLESLNNRRKGEPDNLVIRQRQFVKEIQGVVDSSKDLHKIRSAAYNNPVDTANIDSSQSISPVDLNNFADKHRAIFSKTENNSVFAIQRLELTPVEASAGMTDKQKISVMFMKDGQAVIPPAKVPSADCQSKELVILSVNRTRSKDSKNWVYGKLEPGASLNVNLKKASVDSIHQSTAAWLGHDEGQDVYSAFADLPKEGRSREDSAHLEDFKQAMFDTNVITDLKKYHQVGLEVEKLKEFKNEYGFGDMDEKSNSLGAQMARATAHHTKRNDRKVDYFRNYSQYSLRGFDFTSHLLNSQSTSSSASSEKSRGVQQLNSNLSQTTQQVTNTQMSQIAQQVDKTKQSRSDVQQAAAQALNSASQGR